VGSSFCGSSCPDQEGGGEPPHHCSVDPSTCFSARLHLIACGCLSHVLVSLPCAWGATEGRCCLERGGSVQRAAVPHHRRTAWTQVCEGKAEADPELKPASTAPIAVQLQDATYSWYRQEDRDREQALSQTLQRKGGRASPAPGTGGSGGGLSRGRGKAGDAPAVLSMEAGSSTGESVDDTSSGGFHLKNISL